MTSAGTRNCLNHHREQRLNRVVAFLDAHLEQPLPLARVASIAALSPHHFHRVFRHRYGDTLARYVTRRRLELAATRLSLDPAADLLEVALAVGFGSAEAFSRAFKKRFGHPPSVWRQRCTPWRGAVSSKRLCPRIETLACVFIAYMRYEGPFGPKAGRFWPDQAVPWIIAAGLSGAVRFGIARDDPHVTEPTWCRYDAAVAVPRNYVPPEGVHLGELAGGLYAVLPFAGPASTLPNAWREFVSCPGAGARYELDSRPLFERYAAGYRPTRNRDWLECELCLPIRPRSARTRGPKRDFSRKTRSRSEGLPKR